MSELMQNYQRAVEVASLFNPEIVSVNHRMTTLEKIPTWIVYFHIRGKCYGGERDTFDLALALAVGEANLIPNACPVCGGCLDGPCQHSH